MGSAGPSWLPCRFFCCRLRPFPSPRLPVPTPGNDLVPQFSGFRHCQRFTASSNWRPSRTGSRASPPSIPPFAARHPRPTCPRSFRARRERKVLTEPRLAHSQQNRPDTACGYGILSGILDVSDVPEIIEGPEIFQQRGRKKIPAIAHFASMQPCSPFHLERFCAVPEFSLQCNADNARRQEANSWCLGSQVISHQSK